MNVVLIGLLIWVAPAIILAIALVWVRLSSAPPAQDLRDERDGTKVPELTLAGQASQPSLPAE